MEYTVFSEQSPRSLEKLIQKEEETYRLQIREAASFAVEQNASFVFLAGPSCSGKTTTSLSLAKELERQGKRTFTFSTDDFFFDSENAPRHPDGTPDFDAFEHLDSRLLILVLQDLSAKKSTHLPLFDFKTGRRIPRAVLLSPAGYDVFIVEGIHALNTHILQALDDTSSNVYLYLDVTRGVIKEGETAGMTPEEIRFGRRLIRDFKHRNASAEKTFLLWENVLFSETKILHPFRDIAHRTISTNFSYEIGVVKNEAVPLLKEVDKSSPFFEEAKHLETLFAAFPLLSEDTVPENSVLREFID